MYFLLQLILQISISALDASAMGQLAVVVVDYVTPIAGEAAKNGYCDCGSLGRPRNKLARLAL